MADLKKLTLNSIADDLPLSIIYAESKNPKAILQCCHGMTEHKERYKRFISFMSDNGFHCYLHDKRGHGESILSNDDLGYFYNNGKDCCEKDLLTINNYLRDKYPSLPIFMFGHSMGSLEVRSYCKKYDNTISGLIISGSPSPVSFVPFAKLILKFLNLIYGCRHKSNFFCNLVLGSYNKPFIKDSDSKFNWLSKNKENVKEYDENPLCGFSFTVNGFYTLMNFMTDTYNKKGWQMKNPNMPILFISGKDDPCRLNDKSFQKALNIMKSVGYSKIDYILYEGFRHEILNESIYEKVHNDILDSLNSWLQNI